MLEAGGTAKSAVVKHARDLSAAGSFAELRTSATLPAYGSPINDSALVGFLSVVRRGRGGADLPGRLHDERSPAEPEAPKGLR